MKYKLTIEHLAPYLPYEIRLNLNRNNGMFTADNVLINNCVINNNIDWYIQHKSVTYSIYDIKPILRPLSDLTRELYWELSKLDSSNNFGFWYGKEIIKDKKEYIYREGYSSRTYYLRDGLNQFPYGMMKFFFQNLFDVHGLIKKGLAIDIKTIENNSK